MGTSEPTLSERGRSTTRRPRALLIAAATFMLVCAGLMILTIVVVPLVAPFGGVTEEFTDLSGQEGSQRFRSGWPPGIDPAEVQSVSRKYASSFDAHSCWYRIQLSTDAASAWRNAIHSEEERRYGKTSDQRDEGVEGVHRSVGRPPPLHRQTGTTPDWWLPPAIEFRATELMRWYHDFQSGVGRATYSGYDETTNTLWIYEYSAQHDRLWPPGKLPDGKPFSTIKRAALNPPGG